MIGLKALFENAMQLAKKQKSGYHLGSCKAIIQTVQCCCGLSVSLPCITLDLPIVAMFYLVFRHIQLLLNIYDCIGLVQVLLHYYYHYYCCTRIFLLVGMRAGMCNVLSQTYSDANYRRGRCPLILSSCASFRAQVVSITADV